MTLQNMTLTKYHHVPYDGNTFYWPANRNAEPKQGMHNVTFGANNNDDIVDQLIWKHDPFGKQDVFQKHNALVRPQLANL